jgi:hypothetical protein
MKDKFILHYVINLFIIVCSMIIILINIYYITPNNYEILENNINSNNINIIKTEIVTINPKNNFTIDCDKTKYYKFNKDVNLIISNLYKSQNILLTKSNILETKFNSKITIQNLTSKHFNLEINYCET